MGLHWALITDVQVNPKGLSVKFVGEGKACLFHKGLERGSTSRLVQTQVLKLSRERPLSIWSETEGSLWHSFSRPSHTDCGHTDYPRAKKHTPERVWQSQKDLCLEYKLWHVLARWPQPKFPFLKAGSIVLCVLPILFLKVQAYRQFEAIICLIFHKSSWILDILAQSLSLR